MNSSRSQPQRATVGAFLYALLLLQAVTVWPESSAGAALFSADVRGSRSDELIVAADAVVTIYTDSGRPIAKYPFPAEHAVPVLTLDIDRDGKQEIAFGSMDAPQPTLTVLNGMGRVIFRFIEDDLNATYSTFLPQAYANGLLYVLCGPAWARAARGILAIDAKKSAKAWMYATPSVPVALRSSQAEGRQTFVVSTATRDNSTFLLHGKDATYLAGSDKFIRLFAFDEAGNTLSIEEVVVPAELAPPRSTPRPDGKISGTGHFLPLAEDPDRVLLFHEPDDASRPPTEQLYLVDAGTARALARFGGSGAEAGAVRKIRAVVTGAGRFGSYVYAAALTGDGSALLRLDGNLRETGRASYSSASAGPSHGQGASLQTFGDLLLVRDGDTAAVFDGDLRLLKLVRIRDLRAATLVERPEGPALATLGTELSVSDFSR